MLVVALLLVELNYNKVKFGHTSYFKEELVAH